jgi:hypothetical protein
MALWQAKGMGVLFGGVTDEDRDEETLESVFHRDLSVSYHEGVRALSLRDADLDISLRERVGGSVWD